MRGKKKTLDRVTLTCRSTDAGAVPPFCLEKQKEAIGGRRKKAGRRGWDAGRESEMGGWMDGWRGGRGRERKCVGTGNERAEWF